MKRRPPWLLGVLLLLVVALSYFAVWRWLQPNSLPPYIVSGNGRIEAVEIDIATKTPGRIQEILANEGDFVRAGDVLARMDTRALEAQREEARAQVRRAEIAVETAKALVSQRQAELAAAMATVSQREAEFQLAQKTLARSQELAPRGAVPESRLDEDRARVKSARAAVATAKAQVAATEAAIGAARSQVVDAEAAVIAARATLDRIEAEIDDSVLRSPRDGRVQFRVAQPGEVLAAGGRVLNLVDLSDVYMTFFLSTEAAGRIRIGTEVRLVVDAYPQYVVPARATFVADVAQFTPKTVETAEERQKLMFRIKARIDPDLLRRHLRDVKTGLPGVAYVRLDQSADWPPTLSNLVK